MVEGITMAAKLPLSDVLSAIDRRDFNWYANLDAEKKKAEEKLKKSETLLKKAMKLNKNSDIIFY